MPGGDSSNMLNSCSQDLSKREQKRKNAVSLLWIGDKGRDISNTWTLTEDEAKLLKTYYEKFSEYLTPKANPIFARYKFHEKTQGSGESFEHFVTELKLLVKDSFFWYLSTHNKFTPQKSGILHHGT